MIVVCQNLLTKLKINGIAIFPFIILCRKDLKLDRTLINHEKIHIRQQLELLILFFYLWYSAEYCFWYLKLKNKNLAYKNISFEKEAYAKEEDLKYLKNRKLWSFWKYRI